MERNRKERGPEKKDRGLAVGWLSGWFSNKDGRAQKPSEGQGSKCTCVGQGESLRGESTWREKKYD